MYTPKWFVVHFTGGTPNLQSLYNYWNSSCVSSHFGIERTSNQYAKAGDIWQFVHYSDGSGANCCLENGAAPFLPYNVNLNVRTITVECINPDSSNDGLMPKEQYDSLVWLIREACRANGISTTKYTTYTNQYGESFTFADGNGGVIMHRDICPINRQRCPGMDVYNHQMKDIMREVNGGTSMGSRPFFDPDSPQFDPWVVQNWEQFYRSTGQGYKIPRRDTGLFNWWRDRLKEGVNYGNVMCEEIKFQDHWAIQYFTGGVIKIDFRNGAITGDSSAGSLP
jgi:hypothetical protein